MENTIEKYDEFMSNRGDRRELQTVPNQGNPDDNPNWKFYRDPRDMGRPLLLEDHSGLDLQRIIKAFWYHRGMFATIALLLATFFVMANHILMPDMYEATARVRVKMAANIDDSPQARQTVSIIPTEVLSDKVLTQVITELEMTKKTTLPIIAKLLNDMGIEAKASVEDGSGIMRWLRQEVDIYQERQGMATAVFTVSLTDKDPGEAAEIVNAIVTSYMDLRHTFESSDASEAVAFLQPKVDSAKQVVGEAHQRLTKFKLENSVFLVPATMIEENIIRLDEEYSTSDSRIAQLTELNKGLKKLVKGEPRYVSSRVGGVSSAPDVAVAQLSTLRNRYTLATSRYVAGHPYLRQLRADIKALEQSISRAPKAQARRTSGQVTNSEWLRLTQEITANGAEARVLSERLPGLERQMEKLSEHLANSNSAQAALLTHQTAWDQAYNHYNTLNGRYLDASTLAEAQDSAVGRELSILDIATVPTLPITASRTKLQMLGVLGGFVIAFAVMLIYTRIKNWKIPEDGRQVGLVASIFLNLLGITWLVGLIGYIVINPYI